MNSQDEVNFVRQGQRGFINDTSYYIGGSTNSAPFATLSLSAYRNTSSGISMSEYIINFVFLIKMP